MRVLKIIIAGFSLLFETSYIAANFKITIFIKLIIQKDILISFTKLKIMKSRVIKTYKKAIAGSCGNTLISYPSEALIEKDKIYTEQKVLIPEFSVPGILAKPELEGLTFHFMAFPTIFEYADFRLIDKNKYELLGFNGESVPEFTPELLEKYTEAMEIHFEESNEPATYVENEEDQYAKENITLLTGKVKWHFSNYLRKTTEEENEILYELEEEDELEYENFEENFNYATDYSLPVFKDENGNTLEFVCRIYAPHFPGTHYIFYSEETKLVRQFSQFPKRRNRKIYFKKTKDKIMGDLEEMSDPSKVLADPFYFDQQILLPKYSFPGSVVDKKFSGLRFHFVMAPVFNSVLDFRLTEDNKYELLRFDDKSPENFTPEFIEWCNSEIDDYFNEIPEQSVYFTGDSEKSSGDLILTFGTECSWDQQDYMREKTEEEVQADNDAYHMNMRDSFQDNDYVTDLDAPELKDENGETMKFISKLYAGNVFGTYYLYFSPKTRLVRQFFQCT